MIRAIVDKGLLPCHPKGLSEGAGRRVHSFFTSLTYEDISSLVQMQLWDNVHWNITSPLSAARAAWSQAVLFRRRRGLWVAWPDATDPNTAKGLIQRRF